MLDRRHLLVALAATGITVLGGCATLPSPVFRSDRISVVSVGSGPDVVLIPGLATSRDVWSGVVSALPGYRYHLVQIDGFAGTPPGANTQPGPLLEHLASEICRFILEQRLDDVAVVGHSLGGTLALMTAANLPAVVSKTMVVDNVPFGAMLFAGPDVTSTEARLIGAQARDRFFGPGWRTKMPEIYATMIRNDHSRPTYVAQAQASDGDVSGRLFEEVAATDLRDRLPSINGAVRVLYVGSRNRSAEGDSTDALYRAAYSRVPQTSLVRIENSYHFIMLDQPDEFVRELHNFLG